MPGGPAWLSADVSQGAWVLVVALVLATAFGVYRAARDGRFRGTHRVKGAVEEEVVESVLAGSDIDHELGERATLLQFSSAFCASVPGDPAHPRRRRGRRARRRGRRRAPPRAGPAPGRRAHAHDAGPRPARPRGDPGQRCPEEDEVLATLARELA